MPHLKTTFFFIIFLLNLSAMSPVFIYAADKVHGMPGSSDDAFRGKLLLLGFCSADLINAKEPELPRPLLWKASHNAQHGIILGYERPFSRKLLKRSLVWGLNANSLESGGDRQQSISLYCGLRYFFRLSKKIQPSVTWSAGGLTYMSNKNFNVSRLSEHFTLQNFLRLGFNFHYRNPFFLGVTFYHYSNSDIFEHNKGYDVPWTVTIALPFN